MFSGATKPLSFPNPVVSQVRAWQAINICCCSFPPSKNLYRYLQAFIKTYERDQIIGSFAVSALVFLKKIKFNGLRRMAPSTVEIDALSAQQPIICRFYFLDGKAKAVGVQPSWTASDVILAIASKVGLLTTAGWALFESTPQAEHFIRNHEFIGDILAEWEAEKRSSMKMTKYQTMTRKGATQALGMGDAKFVFRKRLFLNPRDIPTDPEEYRLLYYQAVHSTVRVDEFPVDEAGALMLAGLQLQATWGTCQSMPVGCLWWCGRMCNFGSACGGAGGLVAMRFLFPVACARVWKSHGSSTRPCEL